MDINLTNLINLSEADIKKELKLSILEEEYQFIDKFLQCSKIFNWSWSNKTLDRENVIEQMIEFSYKICVSKIQIFKKKGKLKDNTEGIMHVSSGRIMAICVDTFNNDNKLTIEVEFLSTL